MTAGPWIAFGHFLEDEALGLHDLANDTLKMALVENGWTPDTTNDETWGDISADEVDGTGNGYAQQTVDGQITRAASTVTFKGAAHAEFQAVAAPIENARYAVIYNDTSGDRLICYALLDNTPADVDIPAGSKLRVRLTTAIGTKAPA